MIAVPCRAPSPDASAAVHDVRHARFLRLSGDSAQGVLEGAVASALVPGTRLLDAGCGTGALVRRLLRVEPRLEPTVLDRSAAMLARCADLPARRVHGSLAALPFDGARFDATVCAWALETLRAPDAALEELCRVTRPGGRVFVTCCATAPDADPLDRIVALGIRWRGAGRPLDADALIDGVVARACGRVRWLPCRGAAAVFVVERAA